MLGFITPAGLQVLVEAKSLLAAADATRRRIEDVASGEAGLTVGFFVGDSFTAALEAFGAQYPDVAINLLRIYWNDQTEALLDGRADVAFVQLPVDDHNVDPRPDGRRPRPGPAVDNLEEKLQHVAAGRAISFVPASVAAAATHPGIAYVPVTDIPPIKICLAWKSGPPPPLVAAFVKAVSDARRHAGLQPSAYRGALPR